MTTARKDATPMTATTEEAEEAEATQGLPPGMPETGTLATGFVDRRRVTEDDPDFVRLHAATVGRLRRNIHRMVVGLRTRPAHEHPAVLSRFIHDQVATLRDAYTAGHAAGAQDYFAGISARRTIPREWLPSVDARRLRQRLGFYAPSVAKMAHEASRAWQEDQARKLVDAVDGMRFARGDSGDTPQQLPPGPTYQQLPPGPTYQQLPMSPGEAQQRAFDSALARWEQGLDVRVKLQANVGWTGLQDGYYDGPLYDKANPYYYVYWELEPSALHCLSCPDMADGSPYTPPGSGDGNELTQIPGDGRTECGASCKCSLRYGVQYGPESAPQTTGSSGGGSGASAGAVGADGSDVNPVDLIDWGELLPRAVVQPVGPLVPVGEDAPDVLRAILNPRAPMVPPPDAGEPPQAWEPSALQLRALDLYRATVGAWDGWASATDGTMDGVADGLPPLPDFFGWDEAAAEGFVLPDWSRLTAKQRQLLDQVMESLVLWYVGGTEAGAALSWDEAAALSLGPNTIEQVLSLLQDAGNGNGGNGNGGNGTGGAG